MSNSSSILKVTSIVAITLVTSRAFAETRDYGITEEQNDQRTFVVVYKHGPNERVKVEYVAKLERFEEATGEAWTLKHPYDDRACDWRFTATVERRAVATHRSGRSWPIEEFRQIWYVSKTGDRGANNFLETLTYHRTCGDSADSYSTDLASQRSALRGAFDKILSEDKPKAAAHLKEILGAVEVNMAGADH
jgi:hypothetical protein